MDDMDDDDEDQPEEEDQESNFQQVLEIIDRNECNSFFLGTGLDLEMMTMPQAKALSEALQQNTSVVTFGAVLHWCPLAACSLFADYIRSNPRLTDVVVAHAAQPFACQAIQQSYTSHLDSLFRAVRDNPSIKNIKVYKLASPSSIYDLLANTNSITKFEMDVNRLSADVALSIMAGISRNSSLLVVNLNAAIGPMDVILSGIGASSVESLTVSHREPSANLWWAVSKMLLSTPSLKLKVLTIQDTVSRGEIAYWGGYAYRRQESLGSLFKDLSHPACTTRLQELVLDGVLLADVAMETNTLDDDISTEHVNTKLRKLTLRNIQLESPRSVRLFCNLVGLHELVIHCPTCVLPPWDEGTTVEYWAEFIRRNKELRIVSLSGRDKTIDYEFMHGILDGARRHKSISNLTIKTCRMGVVLGGRLRQVLQESSSLKELNFIENLVASSCSTLLADGLCHNRFLNSLHFYIAEIEAEAVTEIVESLLVNQTVNALSFLAPTMDRSLGALFCQRLSQVLRSNSSLTDLIVSGVDLCIACTMSGILASLEENNTLTSLSFYECLMNNGVMASLGQALESTGSALAGIGLGRFSEDRDEDNALEEGRRAFLRSLQRMPNIRSVDFGETMIGMDEETRRLLLRAVQENKNICYLEGDEVAGTGIIVDNPSILRIEAEINYYLKLNHFGRRLLDTPNVLTSLWPRILAPMTSAPENASALFFFLREYFSRQRQQDYAPTDPQQPPRKKARVA